MQSFQQQQQQQKQQDYLPQNVNKVLKNVTKYVSKPLGLNKPFNESKMKHEVEYASSLILQIMLYFNVYYCPCWFLGITFLLPVIISTVSSLNNDTESVLIILMIFAFIIMVIFEIIRLYLAYIGNLRERVPELTAFWLLTLILELPLCLFELIFYWFIPSQSPMLFSLELIHFIFVSLQTIFGFRALRTLARYQISRFHYRQFDINKQEEVNKAFDWFIEDTDGYQNLNKTK